MPIPRVWIRCLTLSGLLLAALAPLAPGQSIDARLYSEMHWRSIGPPRAGRARALSGVASQPNVFYIGFDNGGVWRSTDFGSTWTPLFDNQQSLRVATPCLVSGVHRSFRPLPMQRT